jgi:hypothetical protein
MMQKRRPSGIRLIAWADGTNCHALVSGGCRAAIPIMIGEKYAAMVLEDAKAA